MRLVIDANVLFSAILKKEGLTHKLIFDERIALYAPGFLLKEFLKYAEEVETRSKMPKDEFNRALLLLLHRIKVVPDHEISPFLPAANSLIVDPKDAPYLACALVVNAEIWSRDPHLLQPRVRRWTTEEIARHLGYFY